MFTTRGKVYALKGYEIPEGNRTSRGKAIVNLLQVKDEKVTSVLAVESFDEAKGKESYIVMCTRKGNIKKTPIKDFANIRRSGIIAIGLEDGDILTSVGHTDGKYEIIIGTREGMSIRFHETDVRSMGRNAMGVRGIRLDKEDLVVGMEVAEPKTKKTLLTVCANGYGKRTKLDEYRNQHRGGSGVITIKANERNGAGLGIYLVEDDDHLMVMTEKGKIIRMPCKDIRAISRNTQGVRLVRLEESDKIASVEPVIDDGAVELPLDEKEKK
jgi:DNA gyrase subunit A